MVVVSIVVVFVEIAVVVAVAVVEVESAIVVVVVALVSLLSQEITFQAATLPRKDLANKCFFRDVYFLIKPHPIGQKYESMALKEMPIM